METDKEQLLKPRESVYYGFTVRMFGNLVLHQRHYNRAAVVEARPLNTKEDVYRAHRRKD